MVGRSKKDARSTDAQEAEDNEESFGRSKIHELEQDISMLKMQVKHMEDKQTMLWEMVQLLKSSMTVAKNDPLINSRHHQLHDTKMASDEELVTHQNHNVMLHGEKAYNIVENNSDATTMPIVSATQCEYKHTVERKKSLDTHRIRSVL